MNQIRLEDVLARDTAVRWFEGVAILRLVCRAWQTQGLDDSRFPSAFDVVLGPGGTIALSGATAGNAVQAAAHLLARMLSDDVPVRLRLAVTRATAMEGADASLAAFAEELTYFERPNPEAIVEDVRRRALLASPLAVTPAVPSVEPAASAEQRAASPASPTHRLHRLALVAAATSAVVCAIVWGVGAGQMPAWRLASPDVERSDSPASGNTASAPRVSHPASVSASRIFPTAPRRTEHTGRPLSAEIESTADVVVFEQLPSHSYLDPINLVDAAAPPSPVERIGAAPASVVDGGAEADRIYTRTDSNVTLPLNVYPRFSTQSALPDASHRTVLELTIGKDGLVEEVKMVTAPRNIHEFMLLSAVKAWRFEPARLGGRAIRFRHTVTLNSGAD